MPDQFTPGQIGNTFTPGTQYRAGTAPNNALNPQTGQALQILSLNLPRVLGGSPIASAQLLQRHVGGGSPGQIGTGGPLPRILGPTDPGYDLWRRTGSFAGNVAPGSAQPTGGGSPFQPSLMDLVANALGGGDSGAQGAQTPSFDFHQNRPRPPGEGAPPPPGGGGGAGFGGRGPDFRTY